MSSQEVVLVTGASTGIGRAIAETLANEGYRVFGTSRNPKHYHEQAFEMLELDVRDSESVRECIEIIMEKAGRLDVLVNNAGYDLYGATEESTFQETFGQVDTNFFGVVRLTQAVLPIMREQGGGKIINIGSIGGYVALPFNSAYNASKFALEGYSESIRYELQQFGIYVSTVVASGVRTESLSKSVQEVAATDSIYTKQRQAMTRQLRKISEDSNLIPQHLAQAVHRIVKTKTPRLRYVVGSGARTLLWLRTLLPHRLFERMVINRFDVQVG